MEGNNERVQDVGNDVPIKCRHWVESETLVDSRDGGEVIVVGHNSSKPVEHTEGTKDVIGKPKVNEH